LLDAGKGDETGIDRFAVADAAYVGAKARLFLPQLRVAAGWRALKLGLHDHASNFASMAQDLIEETGEAAILSDLHNLEAALALDRGDLEDAEACLEKALGVARAQGSKLWELRASIELARLMDSTDRTVEGATVLRGILGGIAEGDCVDDTTTAQAMLETFGA
jgi:predicted ATPase